MNKLISSLMFALIAASPLVSYGETSLEKDPAYLPIDKMLDLKTIRPEVNVNLPRYLLKDAASELNGGPGSPLANTGIDFAELIKDVKLIRLVVIEANKTNRPALDKAVKTLRASLNEHWTPIVSVSEENENVGIYSMGDSSGENMAGLAILVYDDGDAVIGNVVGSISIGKLIKIASQMDKVPKDLLKKLQSLGNQTNTQSGSNVAGEAKSKKRVESGEGAAKEVEGK
jgi:hypothetical protein